MKKGNSQYKIIDLTRFYIIEAEMSFTIKFKVQSLYKKNSRSKRKQVAHRTD